jgi:KDO2-lipid IV(A) lauroyltransferase
MDLRKRGIVKTVMHRIEYVLLVAAGAVFRAMPSKWVYEISRALGFIAFHGFRIRRDVTMDNLRNALGRELSERELEKIACRAYGQIGITFIEMLLAPKLKGHMLEMVDMSDAFSAHDALKQGRGLIMVTGHFGSWELNGASVAAAGIPVTVVAKSQANPYVDTLVNRYRELLGMKVVQLGAPIKHIVRALRDGGGIGLISDQDVGKKGVFVDFFGRKASVPQGAAQLALKYRTPVMVIMTARTAPGKYKSFFRLVEVYPDDTVETLTQRYTKIMEGIIRCYPEQYFWMHRRWKSSPDRSSGT